MGCVTGLGGVFFRTEDPERLRAWYRERLGVEWNQHGVYAFRWRDEEHPERKGTTIVSPFPADTEYFGPGSAAFMLNFRVDDLDALLEQLRAAGVTSDKPVEEFEYGRFAWITDPDGRRVELWEPPRHRDTE